MKNDFLKGIIIVVGVIIIVAILYAISGLCMWGIGNFVLWVFKVNYEWTYLHGLATSLILGVVGGAFKSNSSSK